MKVEPSKNQLEKKYIYGDVKQVEVPNLLGARVEDIYEDLNSDFLLEKKSGSGTVVVNQVPKPGTRLNQGSTIRVYLADDPADQKQDKGTP